MQLNRFFKLFGILLISSAIIVAPVVLLSVNHIFYSFHPSDDGYFLSAARRILAGQIPHKDFIFTRPVFSFVMHSVWYVLPYDLIFIFARASYYFFHAIIAILAFSSLVESRKITLNQSLFLALFFASACLLSIHSYGPMPWYTLDGILISSFGLFFLVIGINSSSKYYHLLFCLGFFLLGLAPWVKQNYALVGVVVLCLTMIVPNKLNSRLKFKTYFLTSYLLPSLLFILFLYSNHGLAQFIEQITVSSDKSELIKILIGPYSLLNYTNLFSVFVGIFFALVHYELSRIGSILYSRKILPLAQIVFFVLVLLLLVSRAVDNSMGQTTISAFYISASYIVSFYIYSTIFGQSRAYLQQFLISASYLVLAFTSSLAFGIQSPVFAVVAICSGVAFSIHLVQRSVLLDLIQLAVFVSVLVLTFNYIDELNYTNPYRAPARSEQTYNLAEVYTSLGPRIMGSAAQYLDFYNLKYLVTRLQKSYPQRKISITPFWSIFYFIFDFDNPLSFDLLMWLEYRGYQKVLYKQIAIQQPILIIQMEREQIRGTCKRPLDPSDLADYAITQLTVLDYQGKYCAFGTK